MPEAFYHIQMAMALFKDRPEKEFSTFFFLVLKSTYLTCKKELALTLVEWKRFTQNSTNHLRDHAYLFINRLEIYLGFSRSIRKELIRNPRLQYLFLKEKKLTPYKLKKLMAHRSIRIDHGDIYYFY